MHVVTVEGVGNTRDGMHPVQERLSKAHGSQCGFCTPGFVMSMVALLRAKAPEAPTEEEIEENLAGNLWCAQGHAGCGLGAPQRALGGAAGSLLGSAGGSWHGGSVEKVASRACWQRAQGPPCLAHMLPLTLLAAHTTRLDALPLFPPLCCRPAAAAPATAPSSTPSRPLPRWTPQHTRRRRSPPARPTAMPPTAPTALPTARTARTATAACAPPRASPATAGRATATAQSCRPASTRRRPVAR